jgi:hypothetical protein
MSASTTTTASTASTTTTTTTTTAAPLAPPAPPLALNEHCKSDNQILRQRHQLFARLTYCVRQKLWSEVHERLNHDTTLPVLLEEVERCARLFYVALECSSDELSTTRTRLQRCQTQLDALPGNSSSGANPERGRLHAQLSALQQAFYSSVCMQLLGAFPACVLRDQLHPHYMCDPLYSGHIDRTATLLCFARLHVLCRQARTTDAELERFMQYAERVRTLALQEDRGQLYARLVLPTVSAAQLLEDVQCALKTDACDVLRALLECGRFTSVRCPPESDLGEKSEEEVAEETEVGDHSEEEEAEATEATHAASSVSYGAWLEVALRHGSCGCVEMLCERTNALDTVTATAAQHQHLLSEVSAALWRQLRSRDQLGTPRAPCARILRTLLRYFTPLLQPTLDQVNVEHGLTPLQACCDRYALESGHGRAYAECAQALVEAGASFEHVVYCGLSCWELAKQQNRLVDELVFARVGTRRRTEFPSLQRRPRQATATRSAGGGGAGNTVHAAQAAQAAQAVQAAPPKKKRVRRTRC